MSRITASQFLPHLGIRPLPEALQVTRRLHGPPVWRQQQQKNRLAARADARRLSQAKQLLQFHRRGDAAVVAIVEGSRASARNVKAFRRLAVEAGPKVPGQVWREIDGVHRAHAGCRLADEPRQVDVGADETQPSQQPRRRLVVWPREVGFRQQRGGCNRVRRHGRLGKAQRVVPRHAGATNAPVVGQRVLDRGLRRFEPLAVNRAGGKHPGVTARRRAGHVERDQPFSIADPAVPGQFGAGARRQQQSRGPGLAPPRDAVGIAGQQRSTQFAFVKVLASFGDWPLQGEPAKLVGRLSQRRSLFGPRVECRKDVAGRRGAHDCTPAQAISQ